MRGVRNILNSWDCISVALSHRVHSSYYGPVSAAKNYMFKYRSCNIVYHIWYLDCEYLRVCHYFWQEIRLVHSDAEYHFGRHGGLRMRVFVALHFVPESSDQNMRWGLHATNTISAKDASTQIWYYPLSAWYLLPGVLKWDSKIVIFFWSGYRVNKM